MSLTQEKVRFENMKTFMDSDDMTRLLLTMVVDKADDLEALVFKYRSAAKGIGALLNSEAPLDELEAKRLATTLKEVREVLNVISSHALAVARGVSWAAELVVDSATPAGAARAATRSWLSAAQ
jgi:hypothetical protein